MDTSTESTKPFLAESKYRDGNESEDWEHDTSRSNQTGPRFLWLAFGASLLLFTNAMTYLFAVRSSAPQNLNSTCARHTSMWSPLLRDVDVKYESVFFNSTLFGDSDKDRIYRQSPSQEVDKAWSDLGLDLPAIILTPDEAMKSGIQLDRVSVEVKDGALGYPVLIEGLHNLHCLDLLRQGLYFNAPRYQELRHGAWNNEEDIIQKHIGHCVNMLRLVLMCNFDTAVLPFIWAKDSRNASYPARVFPDFPRNHQCKNFDTIMQYAKTGYQYAPAKLSLYPAKDSLILPDWP
ncbi:hypothetical protein F5884DRAFT_470306 [Xylogone sp. PMI_703]|nr:hypothetical protein F5884DRAFT_470306 [Xylogone sp. PMI_703]